MHAVHTAAAAVANGANFSHFQSQESLLQSIINGTGAVAKANQGEALSAIEKNLIAAGARRSYAPVK